MIVIIGAGISGLTLAYELEKAKKPYMLIESSSRTGGYIHSVQMNAYTLEVGPNSVLIDSAFQEFLDELKSKKTHILHHTEKSFTDTYMNGVTEYAKKLSHLALKLGNVVMSYLDDDNKVKKYIMKNKIIERDISEKYRDKNLFEDEYIENEVISVLNEVKIENT